MLGYNTAIEIRNTEEDYNTEPLSFTLDNVTFCGTSLSDFHLKDETQYMEACKKVSTTACETKQAAIVAL